MRKAPTSDSQRIFANGIFRGQVAVVTGGGSGIGLATATELARLGAKVAICGRLLDKLESAAHQIRDAARHEAGAEVRAGTCDIREPAQVEAFVADVLDAWQRIDILVNNAGGQFAAPA